MDSSRKTSNSRSSGYKSQDGKSRSYHDDHNSPNKKQLTRVNSKDGYGHSDRHTKKDHARDNASEPSVEIQKNEPTLKKEIDLSVPSTVENNSIIEGLALQRLCDEKPDIDILVTTLMHLYDSMDNTVAQQELLDKIEVTGLRLRAKLDSDVIRAAWRFKDAIQHARHVAVKRRCLNDNVPKLYRNLELSCSRRLWNKSVNDHYDKMYRVITKIPSVPQLKHRQQQIISRQEHIKSQIAALKQQIIAQRSQLEDISNMLTNTTVLDTPSTV
uniref:Uncharacterized protein n=1 Tax=Babesia bovis TaxID=5865 RepID=S6B209_BABBO|nr:hypothetical protein [Babesia bovis]